MPPNLPLGDSSGEGSSETYDATQDFITLQHAISSQNYPIIVPTSFQKAIRNLITLFQSSESEPDIIPSLILSQPSSSTSEQVTSQAAAKGRDTYHQIKVNHKTTLDTLYVYHSTNPIIEYPETSQNGIGYLIPMEWNEDSNPMRNFAYSLGGSSKGKSTVTNVEPPIDSTPTQFHLFDQGRMIVPHTTSYSACRGMKICPFVDQQKVSIPHTSASREALSERLNILHSEQQRQMASPDNGVFLKTLSYFSALRRQGCGSPLYEPTLLSAQELEDRNKEEECRNIERRGHPGKETCKGRLLYQYNSNGHPFIRCEHYDRTRNIDHFIDFTIGDSLLDTDYLEALFSGDVHVIKEFEEGALLDGIGPLSVCTTVRNFSSIKVTCPFDHRNGDNKLINPEMINLECPAKFRLIEPLKPYRAQCPWALIISQYPHTHPIPIPSKTPPTILREITALLGRLGHALPDLTPRRFLRHPILQMFLKDRLPDVTNPMLLDLHPSLANRDHLRHYINEVRDKFYPKGTGWEGLQYLKAKQDCRNSECQYIRFIGEYSDPAVHVDETDVILDPDAPLRIIVCMLKENSVRLLNAQYIQSDIGFKRVVGWKEFELGARDAVSRITTTYCRVYTNRQTAEAHRKIFHKIDEIVKEDTGLNLTWRHIHSVTPDVNSAMGACLMTVDSHGGQAKGFGLYLCDVSRKLPQKRDLHEPHRYIQDLDEYEHLRRILRLCRIHFLRKIQACAVSDSVKEKMRGLMSAETNDIHGILETIEDEGGKAGKVADKVRSKFAIPGICWSKSYIPLSIWQTGDNTSNIVEQLHEDVNREGILCTLVGGVRNALHFDTLKSRTIENFESTGVYPSYQRGHISESASRSIHRKAKLHTKILGVQDSAIQAHNSKLEKAYRQKEQAEHSYSQAIVRYGAGSTQTDRAMKTMERSQKTYDKMLNSSLDNVGTGSGKVGILLPSDTTGIQ